LSAGRRLVKFSDKPRLMGGTEVNHIIIQNVARDLITVTGVL
jgi:hypothetical protein